MPQPRDRGRSVPPPRVDQGFGRTRAIINAPTPKQMGDMMRHVVTRPEANPDLFHEAVLGNRESVIASLDRSFVLQHPQALEGGLKFPSTGSTAASSTSPRPLAKWHYLKMVVASWPPGSRAGSNRWAWQPNSWAGFGRESWTQGVDVGAEGTLRQSVVKSPSHQKPTRRKASSTSTPGRTGCSWRTLILLPLLSTSRRYWRQL